MGHYTPNHQLVFFCDLNRFVAFVFSHKPHAVLFDFEPFDCEITVDQTNRNLPVLGLQATVNDQQITVV